MTKPIPTGFHTVTPHITVKGAEEAIAFYGKAFGASETHRHVMGDRIGHAELALGDSRLMLNDEFPDMGVTAPPETGSGVVIHLYVEDCDAAFARAVDAGCKAVFPLTDMFWGDRYGQVLDPFGHKWSIATHKEDLSEAQIAERAAQAFPPQ